MRLGKPVILTLSSLICFIAAMLLYLYAEHNYYGVNAEPVCEPVDVVNGFRVDKDFTVENEADYDVGFKCKRAIPFEALDGILQNDLRLGYTVFENGRILTHEDSLSAGYSSASTQDDLTRMLCMFHAAPGNRYHIALEMQSSLPALKATEPKLIVDINIRYWMNYFMLRGMKLTLIIIVFGVAGVVLLVSASIVHLKCRTKI